MKLSSANLLRTASLGKPGMQPARYFLAGKAGAIQNLEEQILFRLLNDCMIGNTNNSVCLIFGNCSVKKTLVSSRYISAKSFSGRSYVTSI